MASASNDPLRSGFDQDDMEDLTAQLENNLGTSSLLQQRGSAVLSPVAAQADYRSTAGVCKADDGQQHLQGVEQFKGLAHGDDENANQSSGSANPFPSYGQAGGPPSYEDSIMYEDAHHAHHATYSTLTARPSDGPLASNPFADQGPGASASASSQGGGYGNRSLPFGAPSEAGYPGISGPQSAAAGAGAGSMDPLAHAASGNGMHAATAVGWAKPRVSSGSGAANPFAAAAHNGVSTGSSTAAWGSSMPGQMSSSPPSNAHPSMQNAAQGGLHTAGLSPLGSTASSNGSLAGAIRPIQARRASAAASGPALTVSVTDPVKKDAGGLFGLKNGYTSYLVTSMRSAGGAAASSSSGSAWQHQAAEGGGAHGRGVTYSVRRRFRDFVALAALLKAKYRGYFIPPRPHRNAVEGQRATEAFIEERRSALEKYLCRLAQHPVIANSDELRIFLQEHLPGDVGELADSAAWAALAPLARGSVLDGTARFSKQLLGLDKTVLDPVQAVQPIKKSADFMRAIKETAHKMQSAPPGAVLPEGEVVLRTAKEGMEGLKEVLTAASRAAEKLVHCQERRGVVLGDMGLALFKASKSEETDGQPLALHTGTLKESHRWQDTAVRLGNAAVRESRGARKASGRTACELEVMHDYLAMMPAALKGLRGREKQLLTADTLAADTEARRRELAALEAAGSKTLGGDTARAKKLSDLRNDIHTLELSTQAARSEYERIKGINALEVHRVRTEMHLDLGVMMQRLATVMAASTQRSAEVWIQVAGELGASASEISTAKAPLSDAGIMLGDGSVPAAGSNSAPGSSGGVAHALTSSMAADLHESMANPFAAPL